MTCLAKCALLLPLFILLEVASVGSCGLKATGTSEQLIKGLLPTELVLSLLLLCALVLEFAEFVVAVSISIKLFKFVGIDMGNVVDPLNFGFFDIAGGNDPRIGKLLDISLAIVLAKRSLYFRRSDSVIRFDL